MILLLIIIIVPGCKTYEPKDDYIESIIILRPKREVLEEPQDINDMVEIIIYYESLLQEWEAWGNLVESSI